MVAIPLCKSVQSVNCCRHPRTRLGSPPKTQVSVMDHRIEKLKELCAKLNSLQARKSNAQGEDSEEIESQIARIKREVMRRATALRDPDLDLTETEKQYLQKILVDCLSNQERTDLQSDTDHSDRGGDQE